jgi:hypothetical protein
MTAQKEPYRPRPFVGDDGATDPPPIKFRFEYSNRAVARLLGVTPETIKHWQDHERMASFKRGRCRFVTHNDLIQFCGACPAFWPAHAALERSEV